MEFEEEEVKPGIYMTDFRKKSKGNKLIAISPEEYKIELQQKGLIHPDFLRSERTRFETSISKLEETNDELRTEPDLSYIITENEEVIERHKRYIQILNSLLGEDNSIYL